MNTLRLETVATDSKQDIPMQPASQDIWDKKYRLKTKAGDAVGADLDGC
jgi:ribonucleoside-diphosphate reductase alpha chain